MHIARGLFAQWQDQLETAADMYALRLFAPGGGVVWRNAASRNYYETRGFFAAPIMAWKQVCKYLTPAERAAIEAQYVAAFRTGEMVEFVHTSQAAGQSPCQSMTRFLALYGNLRHGVLLTHLQPLAVSGGFSPMQLADLLLESS